jgi:hypothetical protein
MVEVLQHSKVNIRNVNVCHMIYPDTDYYLLGAGSFQRSLARALPTIDWDVGLHQTLGRLEQPILVSEAINQFVIGAVGQTYLLRARDFADADSFDRPYQIPRLRCLADHSYRFIMSADKHK